MRLKDDQGKPVSKVEKRITERLKLVKTKLPALSAMHQNVIKRPMDQGISKLLELRRAQAKEKGTSVFRIKRRDEQESSDQTTSIFRLNKDKKNEENDKTVSVGRLRQDRLKLIQPIQNKIINPRKGSVGDLN